VKELESVIRGFEVDFKQTAKDYDAAHP